MAGATEHLSVRRAREKLRTAILVQVRRGHLADLPHVLRIYNDAVVSSTATFDTETVSLESRLTWFERFDDENPIFVCEGASGVLGYAYYLPYRPKAAYAATREATIYVDAPARGRGVGTALYGALIEHARGRGVHALVAVLGGENPASEALHLKVGFEAVGRLREVGYKYGRWLDTAFYELILVLHEDPQPRR
jgi:L-amino acid N-acyltransferase